MDVRQWDESVEMKYEIQSIWMSPSGISMQDRSQRGCEASPSLWRRTRPWATLLNQSLGLDVLIFPALSIGPCARHSREEKATVSQKLSWQLSTINKNLLSPDSVSDVQALAGAFLAHTCSGNHYYMYGGTQGTNMYPALWTLGDRVGNEMYINKNEGGFLANKVLSGC